MKLVTILAEGCQESELEDIIEDIDSWDEMMEGYDEENEYLEITIQRKPK